MRYLRMEKRLRDPLDATWCPVVSYVKVGVDKYEVEKFEYYDDTKEWHYVDRSIETDRSRICDLPYDFGKIVERHEDEDGVTVSTEITEADYLSAKKNLR
jgi:hypothetical protein